MGADDISRGAGRVSRRSLGGCEAAMTIIFEFGLENNERDIPRNGYWQLPTFPMKYSVLDGSIREYRCICGFAKTIASVGSAGCSQ